MCYKKDENKSNDDWLFGKFREMKDGSFVKIIRSKKKKEFLSFVLR